jgi:predicted metalloprotease
MTQLQRTSRAGWSMARRGLVCLAATATAATVALSGMQGAAATSPVDPNGAFKSTGGNINTQGGSDLGKPAVAGTATTPQSAYNVLKYNRIYKSGTVGARCREPQYPLTTVGNVLAYHRSILYCLNNSFVHNIKRAKFRFAKPTLVVWTAKSIRTACGTRYQWQTAAYCSTSKGIYIPATQYIQEYRKDPLGMRAYAGFTAGHEYGHHVQAMTGILAASHYRDLYVLKTSGQRDEESRRVELQASCLSAAWFGADRNYYPMRGAFATQWKWMVKNMGDENSSGPNDHGSKRSHNFWTTRGYNYMSPYSCMTWAVSSYYVW